MIRALPQLACPYWLPHLAVLCRSLDEPDFFWENEEYLAMYTRTNAYLDVSDRARILNTRLDVIEKLLDNLTTQLQNEQAHHLEWIVIWLIVVEVVLDMMHGSIWNRLFRALGLEDHHEHD